jgi:hypothetical protein
MLLYERRRAIESTAKHKSEYTSLTVIPGDMKPKWKPDPFGRKKCAAISQAAEYGTEYRNKAGVWINQMPASKDNCRNYECNWLFRDPQKQRSEYRAPKQKFFEQRFDNEVKPINSQSG